MKGIVHYIREGSTGFGFGFGFGLHILCSQPSGACMSHHMVPCDVALNAFSSLHCLHSHLSHADGPGGELPAKADGARGGGRGLLLLADNGLSEVE